MKGLLLLIFVFCAYFLTAQQSVINGHLMDAKSGDPIGYASIKVDLKAVATTDSIGNFTLSVDAGKHEIVITKVGYSSLFQTVRVGFEERVNVLFTLEQFVNELEKVVVSGSKQERLLVREPVSITSIQPYLIANSNSNTLSDVLNKVPGVSVIEGQAIIRGAVGWSYNVGSRVMVVLDDMPLMGPDVGDVQWDLMPIEAAENIEVLKGPSSVLYGSSASSGTITLRTGWPTNKPETKIQTYQGITNTPRTKQAVWWEKTSQPFNSGGFFSHKQKFGQFDLVTSGNVDMVRSYIQQNDSYRARMYVKTRYRFKNIKGLSVGLNGNVMFKKAGRYFLWENADSGLYIPADGSAGQDFYRIWSIDPNIIYTKPNNYTLSLRFRQYQITRFVDTTTYKNGQHDAVANGQSMDLNFQKKWFKGFSTISGVYVTRIWAVGNVYPGDHTGYSAAAYTQAEYQYNRFTINAGLRYEFNALGPIEETTRPLIRGGINYKAAKKTYLRATYGEGYRFPTIAERYVSDNLNTLSVFPNPGLKSERGWYTEFGVKQGFSIGRNFNATADVAFFWQEYTNLIEFHYDEQVPLKVEKVYDYSTNPPRLVAVNVIQQSQLGFKAINLDRTRTAGAEISIEGSGKINELGIRTLCGYTYVYPVDLGANPSLQDFGAYMSGFFRTFNHLSETDKATILRYRNRKLIKGDIEFSFRKFMIGYSVYYYSQFDNIDPRLYDAISGVKDFMDARKSGDWVHNARFGYQINSNVTVAFLVNNIENREYAIRPARMDPPRNYTIQFRMKF